MNEGTPTVAAERYTSPTWLARELELVFGAAWLLAVHASEIETPGAFTTIDIAGESVLITRGEDGKVRAFYNVCRHRGVLLCVQPRGRTESFRCPYHHWEYAINGRLLRAPQAGIAAASSVGRALALKPIHCVEYLGFVWISMALSPVDIDVYLAPVADAFARHRPQEYRLAHETVVEVEANWKTSVDVNNEGYHLPTLHPEICDVIDVSASQFAICGDHSTVTLPIGRPGRVIDPDEPIPPAMRNFLQWLGINNVDPDGRLRDVRSHIARSFRERAKREGFDFSSRSDEQLTCKEQIHVFPNVQLNFLPFSLEVYRHRPHPTDPSRCWFDELTYVRDQAKSPGNVLRRQFRHGEQDLGPVMGADVDMLPRLQAGMRSRSCQELRFTEGEAGIVHMHRVLDAWFGGSRWR